MKTIHIVEGIMSLVGKVSKAFSKFNKLTKDIQEKALHTERLRQPELQVEDVQLEKENSTLMKQQLKEQELQMLKAEQIEVEETVDIVRQAELSLLKVKSLRLEQRLHRGTGHRIVDKNKGVIIPLHRRGAYQMKHKVSKSQGKVVYLHQREPTLLDVSAKSAYDKEKGTGS